MKIFGTIFPFIEPNSHDFRMGRFIANYDFLSALLQHGHFDSYHLFCMNPQHLQATVQRLQDDSDISAAAKARIQVFMYSSLTEKLQTETYHIFHLGGWGYFFSGLAYLRNRYAKTPFPISAVIHSLNARDTRYDFYKLLKAPIAPCDAVICSSKAGQAVMAKQLERIAELEHSPPYQGQLPIIPLGVNSIELPDKSQCRQALGIADNCVVLLYTGRLSPATKGDLYPLLQCFKQLLGNSQQALTLILAGGADATEQQLHRDIINELGLEQAVLLLANFDPSIKSQLYSAADISVAPADNLQETFGLSIVESMQAGLPVVASDFNGYKDLIDDGVNGFRIHTTWIDQLAIAEMDEIMASDSLQTLLAQTLVIDLEQMQQKLQLLIDNPELRQQLGNNGKDKVAQRFLWPIVIQRYEALWDQLNSQSQHCDFAAPSQSPFSNDYLASFSHYPSTLLADATPVALTTSGKQSLLSGQTPPIYSDVAMLLNQEWLTAVMNDLDSTDGKKTAGELFSRWGDEGNKGRFSLMWAAKYGLLRLGEQPDD